MNDALQDRALRVRAMDIARRLRAVSGGRDLWVSTEARVLVDGVLLRPAVLAAVGDPPYNGILTLPPLLVVELAAADVERWEACPATTVWGPDEGTQNAVVLGKGRRRRVRPGGVLTVSRHPSLRLEATFVCRGVAPAEGKLAG